MGHGRSGSGLAAVDRLSACASAGEGDDVPRPHRGGASRADRLGFRTTTCAVTSTSTRRPFPCGPSRLWFGVSARVASLFGSNRVTALHRRPRQIGMPKVELVVRVRTRVCLGALSAWHGSELQQEAHRLVRRAVPAPMFPAPTQLFAVLLQTWALGVIVSKAGLLARFEVQFL